MSQTLHVFLSSAPRLVRVSETTPSGSLLHSFTVVEDANLFRGVRCRLAPKEAAEFFELGAGEIEFFPAISSVRVAISQACPPP